MSGSIGRMLWGAFTALALFVALGVVLTAVVLQMEKQEEHRLLEGSRPLLDAVRHMEVRLDTMVSASRAYALSGRSQFTEQYSSAARGLEEAHTEAVALAGDPRDQRLLADFRRHAGEIKRLADSQIALVNEEKIDNAKQFAVEVARIRGEAPKFVNMIVTQHLHQANQARLKLENFRQWVLVTVILLAIAIVAAAALTAWKIEQKLNASIAREVRRTEAMIAGMSDGVMLVDGDGSTVFINPAGQKLLGRSDTGIPITKQAEIYGFRDENGRPIDEKRLPAAQALSTGLGVNEVTMKIVDGQKNVAISMSATPLQEEGRTSGVIVTFRDITERRRFEEEIRIQAERSQILADAGTFFSSNIDPIWVTQAIAERVAEVLGDWSAVILRTDDSKELRVASIHHRDTASMGLAWSYIYRQPLQAGEGIIGQVVTSGFPSLTTNLGNNDQQTDTTSYHTPSMQLASLLVLPLRTRRETLGALVIAANDPDRAMTEEKLPLAGLLAERAALAVENSKLYTEQVEARRKVEDLSRLKDEFLSIASHELRTPVTSIKGYTQLAKTLIRENDLETSEEYLDIALDQIDRMSRLILELLDVSRIETGRLDIRREEIRWASFVGDVVHRHQTAVTDRRFHVNLPLGGSLVSGDRDRLEQVLGNLIENAVKYSPDGSEIFVNVEEKEDHLLTSVCDRGIGIPADELAQVFERFHRGRQVSSTNYGGLGLGLYITKQIVERHSGSIWVESKEGHGTTFFFTLPTASVDAAAEPAAATRT